MALTDALALLEEAVRHGLRDAKRIASDDDLKSLRGDPRFEAVLADLNGAHTEQR